MPAIGTFPKVYAGPILLNKVYAGPTQVWTGTKVAAKFIWPNISNNYLSIPVASIPFSADDLEIVVRLNSTNWAATPNYQAIYSRYNNVAGQRSYVLRMGPTGAITVTYSIDGSA